MGKNLFNSVKVAKNGYNRFDLTHDVKFSCNMGQLIPICLMDVTPGDKWTIGSQSLVRFAPLIAPVMHRMNIFIHYFFCPYRILWPNWETWITHGGADPATFGDPLPAFPYLDLNGATTPVPSGSLADYLGIPPPPDENENTERVSAMPFLAYERIYQEFYRDENLVDENLYQAADGNNSAFYTLNSSNIPSEGKNFGALRNRAWEHDYFTSALPFAQKGPAVDIPLGTLQDAWVKFDDGTGIGTTLDGTPTDAVVPAGAADMTPANPGLYAETSALQVGSTTINDLRRSYALQRYFEKLARGGSRLKEFIKSMFNVNTGDARLQRPEYITGIKSPVVISEILNTTGTDDLPQGNMAGHGISVANGKYGTYYAKEHGIIMGIMSVLPLPAYQQGIEKQWQKYKDPTQFFTPDFAHIGEQEIESRELAAWQSGPAGDEVFGYIPRYAEYKYAPSRVMADFRTTLDFWHMSRIFNTPPVLNQLFIECVTDDRQFAVIDETIQKLYVHVLNDLSVARQMPKYGTPTF